MADSIPQLKSDINAMQGKLAKALARIAELESAPPVVIEKPVPMPAEKPVIDRRTVDTQVVYVEKEKPVAMPPERIVEYRDRVDTVIVVSEKQDKAKDSAILELQAEILDLKAKLSAEKRKKRKVEVKKEYIKVPIEVERIVYRDNNEHIETIRKLQEKLMGK